MSIPLFENSDDFLFDAEILTQIFFFGYRVGEVTSPCNDNGPRLAL